MNAHLQPTGSAYFLTQETQTAERHTLSVLVDNEPGILARVVGLFSARGFNIESLTVSETEHDKRLSRITVVVIATPKVLVQIKTQLERLVPVHRVHDLTAEGAFLERELALIKVRGTGEHRTSGHRPVRHHRGSRRAQVILGAGASAWRCRLPSCRLLCA